MGYQPSNGVSQKLSAPIDPQPRRWDVGCWTETRVGTSELSLGVNCQEGGVRVTPLSPKSTPPLEMCCLVCCLSTGALLPLYAN